MIPLRDVIPSRTTPWMTLTIVAVNLLIFAYTRALDAEGRLEFFFAHAVVPGDRAWASVFTSLFLHSGWLHLGANVLALWIFGSTVEDRMGHVRFLIFYGFCGAAGALAAAWAVAGLVVPIAGPGAAIAGVVGAYVVLFPQSRILVLLPLVVAMEVIEVPAVLVAVFWVLMQLVGDLGRIVSSPGDTAFIFWSHAAGALAGVISVWTFRRRERMRVEWWS